MNTGNGFCRNQFRSKRIILLVGLAMILALGSRFVAHASSDDDPNGGKYAIGLWGDLPYTTPTSDIQATVGVPNLIADMNSQKLEFTAHDGDLKAGSFRPCNDQLYVDSLAYLN